jgi:RND family efflux transporter MFP subunit
MTIVMRDDVRHLMAVVIWESAGEIAMARQGHLNSMGAAGALLLVTATLPGCHRAAAQPPRPPPAVTVSTPVVRTEADWSEHPGHFVPVETVDVRPRVSGYLSAAHFHDGQMVKKGQLLFTIDPLPFQARAQRARADLAQAEARLTQAQSEARRAETLHDGDAISDEEFISKKQAQAQALAARDAARAALQSEALDLGYTRVLAPISGRISDRRVDPGNLVTNGETVLTQIVTVDPIRFEFAAADGALPPQGLSQATDARIQLQGETGFSHPGRVDFVDNRVDVGTGSIRGRVVLSNANGAFTAGSFGRVRIFYGAPRPIVLIPDEAIGSDQSNKFVLVVNAQDQVEARPVILGPALDGLRVVKSGLGPGDRLVIHGLQYARPGQKVRPILGAIGAQTASQAPPAQPQG